MRPTAALVLLAALAGVGHACPWWGRRCPPPPIHYYPPGPPPVVIYTIPPPTPAPPAPASAPAPEPPKAPAEPEFDPSALYERYVKSCVFIVTPMKGGHAEGSGTLIDAEKRYVITCYHVVGDTDTVFVQFPVRNKDGSLMTDKKTYIGRIPAGQALKGKVLFRDKSRDLALIQLDRLPPDTPALPLAPKSVQVGERVTNIGNPGKVDTTFSMTEGKVRAVGFGVIPLGSSDGVRMVTVTNPISPGDSGGPVIDRHGYQVAVTLSGRTPAPSVNGCIDVTEVRAFLAEKRVRIKELAPAEPGEESKPPDGRK